MSFFCIAYCVDDIDRLFWGLQEACCAYVLMVTAVYWVSEAVPLGAAALVPAFLYPLFGVLKSSEVSPSFQLIVWFELQLSEVEIIL